MLSSFFTSLIAVAVLLGILVFIHELGHYLAAKLFGVRVEVFSLGFGKRLFGFRRGDTDYRVSALPLGGYVKMSGENPMEESTGDPGEFMSHPRWQRFVIALAGPAMNMLLAVVALTFVYMVRYEHPEYLDEPAVILKIANNSPAAKAGLQANDRIVRIEGKDNPNWETVRNQMLISSGDPLSFQVKRGNELLTREIQLTNSEVEPLEQLGITPYQQIKIVEFTGNNTPAQQAGLRVGDRIVSVNGKTVYDTREFFTILQVTKELPVPVQVERNGTLLSFTVTPRLMKEEDGTSGYRVGFASDFVRLPLGTAFVKSLDTSKKFSFMIFDVLQRLAQKPAGIRKMSGPIGIAQQSGKVVHEGPLSFLVFMSLVSINLGIFNLLPIPILDGGLILLLIIEGVLRHDIRREVKERVYQAAFVFLVIFAAFIIYNDITKTALGHWLHSHM